MDNSDIEWFTLEMNLSFLDSTKYCILESFVDYDDYSISSKGFLPMVVFHMLEEQK